jgi:hypothetical protein
MPDYSTLLAEVLVTESELDEAQRMNDRARKTFIGNFPPIRAALERHQNRIAVHRIKIEAAKKYLQTMSH